MSLAGFKATNHPQQIGKRGRVDRDDDRGTALEDFLPLDERFGGFTVDVAAAAHNAKVARYYDRETDGLAQSRAGERVWCNPPYSDLGAWVRKAWDEHATANVIVMLVPASRTEQAWWQEHVEPFRDRPTSPLRVEFLAGRRRFIKPGDTEVKPNNRPPFGSCLLIWRNQL